MTLLKDISPLHAEILDGKHDEELESLRQAINYRMKVALKAGGIKPGAIVTIVDDPIAGKLAGMQAKVIKVNQKSVSIDLIDDSIPQWSRGYRVAPSLIAGPA